MDKNTIIETFRGKLVVFLEHFTREAEAETENIIENPLERLSELLYETAEDISDTTNDNDTPLTYGSVLDTLAKRYKEATK